MNSASVDLIYLDPPFNSKANYAAPIGSKAAGAAFKDTWGLDDINLAWHGEIKHEYPGLYALLQAARQIHGDSMMSYLIYMAIRLMEMKRLLKPTGSIYLHCDPTASHYLKLLMDAVYDWRRFRNEIIWCYGSGGASKRHYSRKHDVILFYAIGDAWTFNVDAVREPYSSPHKSRTPKVVGDRIYTKMNPLGRMPFDWWQVPILTNSAKERTGYPTQKPLALLDRIIRASSNEGDMILDPFCGCATSCVASERLHRQWVGIDISPKAADLVKLRMEHELGFFYSGAHRTDIPERTDLGTLIRYNDAKNKRWLYGEQGGYCNGCEEHFELRNFTVDHIVPKAKGGTDHISNLQLLCGACNSLKGNRPHEYLLKCLTDKGWIKRKTAV